VESISHGNVIKIVLGFLFLTKSDETSNFVVEYGIKHGIIGSRSFKELKTNPHYQSRTLTNVHTNNDNNGIDMKENTILES